ncbi:hypothetical protein [Phycicoccus avicenniae]|uniref:hypothetical protein n=1 Tax=Phycicoccus avicenniae TaxID=2828860 RepID=UPI003D2E4F4E
MDMTGGADADAFVAARWSDLEAVALVATLDEGAAREATTAALAALRRRWAEVLEEGSPTTAARRAVLERVAPAPSRGPGRGRRPVPAPALPDALPPLDPDDAALLPALTAETPEVRAALAADVVWDQPPAETAALLRRPDLPAAVEAARERLLTAHRAARAVQGLGPADHALDPDLTDLVHALGTGRGDPPEPASVVEQRVRRVRRRSVLLGGGVAAAGGALAWWQLAPDGSAPAATAPRPVPSRTTPGPDSPVWASTALWPPRGVLASDLGVQALVARGAPGSRILLADDVAGVRTVLAANLAAMGVEDVGTEVRLWAGALGAPAEQLIEIPMSLTTVYGVADFVAVGVPHPTGALVLVLARPDAPPAELSLFARPAPSGDVEREWEDLPLQDGVAVRLLDAPPSPAVRIRGSRYDGPLPRPEAWGFAEGGPVEQVAAITGIPARSLRSRVVSARLPGGITLPNAGSPPSVLSMHLVTTPDGGVVRTIGAADGLVYDEPTVIPAARAEGPYLTRLDDYSTSEGLYLVLVESGASSVELRSGGSRVAPAVRVRDRLAVVRGPAVDDLRGVTLRVRSSTGKLLWDRPSVTGRNAYDVYPPEMFG